MQSPRNYDINSPESIRDYAKQLNNKSLLQVLGNQRLNSYKINNKGGLGSMVEESFFEYKPGPNLNHDPDFIEAGLELKVTGVLNKKVTPGSPIPYKAKERLVLTMISYISLAEEKWDTSGLMKKCRSMLILFYLYEKNVLIFDYKFVLPPLLWDFPDEDLEIIEKDWLTIQQKVLDGKAHEISEGDTFYLAACRKGSGGLKERLREQPYSDIPAKARAFSLKPTYVNTMIAAAWKQPTEEKLLLQTRSDAEAGIEQVTLNKFKDLHNISVDNLSTAYEMSEQNIRSKSYFFTLSMRILGTKKKYIPEFEKAGIIVKTIRLNHNGMPKESMSFPTFKFIDIANQDWEQSDLYDRLNQKFFFVVFKYDKEGILRFEKAMFWNMPYLDRESAAEAWRRTKQSIISSRSDSFPKMSNSKVIHVRPHGRNNKDVLPFPDGSMHAKQCFWINAKYIASQIKD